MERLINAKEKIIRICADYFNNAVTKNGFEDFKEMKDNYSWDGNDIRAEIDAVISSFLNKLYADGVEYDISHHDDCSLEIFENSGEYIQYKDLKKEIFKLVK